MSEAQGIQVSIEELVSSERGRGSLALVAGVI